MYVSVVLVASGGATNVVEELAVLGGKTDLHDARSDDEHLVIPDARVDLERASNALERRYVTTRLRKNKCQSSA